MQSVYATLHSTIKDEIIYVEKTLNILLFYNRDILIRARKYRKLLNLQGTIHCDFRHSYCNFTNIYFKFDNTVRMLLCKKFHLEFKLNGCDFIDRQYRTFIICCTKLDENIINLIFSFLRVSINNEINVATYIQDRSTFINNSAYDLGLLCNENVCSKIKFK